MICSRKKKGFTVIELIIVVALTVVVLGIVWQMFGVTNKIISDVTIKSDLQREGQSIQEKLSNIGMQATEVKELVYADDVSGSIKKIKINSYDKDGNNRDIEVNLNGEILTIDGQSVSSHVKSINVNPEIIREDDLNNISYIDFTIFLGEKKNYNSEIIENQIKVRTVFRNKHS
ncbi:type II secretion system protein [Clostridium beijerinckii]|uniref:type II secretion system protein n=1 Tax=Clostridium beijerinckii TaxID=1520 RepID=UPI000313F3C4|nr:prepilin-type N-terminal cleavage/methylation domain-containing protein [Clostridium beijerinckii]NRT73590.1 prepilin-type N-terminal cleavage/methylation domain-containing protein [Clostridium beijerinckii]